MTEQARKEDRFCDETDDEEKCCCLSGGRALGMDRLAGGCSRQRAREGNAAEALTFPWNVLSAAGRENTGDGCHALLIVIPMWTGALGSSAEARDGGWWGGFPLEGMPGGSFRQTSPDNETGAGRWSERISIALSRRA
jgi:hypothetical protein